MFFLLDNHLTSKSSALSNKYEGTPARVDISFNLFEFELFTDPTTKIISHLRVKSLTAFCLLVVA